MRIHRIQDRHGDLIYAEDHGDGRFTRLEGDLLSGFSPTAHIVKAAKLLAPLRPAAILCIGLNYRKHAEETGAEFPKYPVVFMKNPATLQHPGDPILLPTAAKTTMVDYECELAVVIGKTCKNIREDETDDVIAGYTCANDVSARDWQKHRGGGQWVRGKSFDTFCPLGPCIVTKDELGDPNSLSISTTVGEEKLQDWNTNDMIFSVPQIVSFLSQSTTLLAGTVILTGTPHGVGMARDPARYLQAGETVTIEIEKIGKLTNPVELE